MSESRSFVLSPCQFEIYTPNGITHYKQRVRFGIDTLYKKIPVGLPVQLHVGQSWVNDCMDRPFGEDGLRLKKCKPIGLDRIVEQAYVWRGRDDWHFNQLMSLVDDRCVAATATKEGTQPLPGGTLVVKDCNGTDKFQRWMYSYGKGFIKMAEWPKYCMNYNRRLGQFDVGRCKYGTGEEYDIANSSEELEVLGMGFEFIREDTPIKVMHGKKCLQRPYSLFQPDLTLRACSPSVNQMFVWHGADGSDFRYLASHIDNTCLGVQPDGSKAEKPAVGTPLTFLPCEYKKSYVKWSYGYGPQQLRMAEWPDLCAEFRHNLDRYVLGKCGLPWTDPLQAVVFDGTQPATNEDRESAIEAKSLAQQVDVGVRQTPFEHFRMAMKSILLASASHSNAVAAVLLIPTLLVLLSFTCQLVRRAISQFGQHRQRRGGYSAISAAVPHHGGSTDEDEVEMQAEVIATQCFQRHLLE